MSTSSETLCPGQKVGIILTGDKAGLYEAIFLGEVPTVRGMKKQFQTEDGTVLDETECWYDPALITQKPVDPLKRPPISGPAVKAMANLIESLTLVPVYKSKKK